MGGGDKLKTNSVVIADSWARTDRPKSGQTGLTKHLNWSTEAMTTQNIDSETDRPEKQWLNEGPMDATEKH